MKKVHLIILSLFCLLSPNAFASFEITDDGSNQKRTYKEITKTDITKYATIKSNEILVFGISFNK